MSAPWSPAATLTHHINPGLKGCFLSILYSQNSVFILFYLKLAFGHFPSYGDKKELGKRKEYDIQYDKGTMLELNPENRDVACILFIFRATLVL